MRVQSLNVGSFVRHFLLESEDLAELVGDKVFPLVAPEGTCFPYIAYSNTSLTSSRDKDSYFYEQDAYMTIAVCTEDYTSGVDIAMEVTRALQRPNLVFEDIEALECTLDERSEQFLENTYIQALVFHLKLK